MSDWVRSIADSDVQRSKAAQQAARKRQWVTGSELTAAQLAEIQPSLKQAFLERENRRAA